MFGRRKKIEPKSYDKEKLEPVIRKSICTGEEVAGFMDRETGHFTSLMLITSEKDLEAFKAEWGIDEIRIIY